MAQQFKVPQNLDIEDKIFGPFTLKQFLYLVGGAFFAYFLYLVFVPLGLVAVGVAVFPIVALTFALVFVKINERPFTHFLMSFASFASQPKDFIWTRYPGEVDIKITSGGKAPLRRKEVKKIIEGGEGVESRLARLAALVDARGWSEEEVSRGELSGRIVSSVAEKMEIGVTLPQERELEDIFAAFEKTLFRTQEEEELTGLGKSLAEILAERSRSLKQQITK